MTHRGDVIAAMPDGWDWSDEEKTNPAWRILKMPTLTQAEADSLLAAEENVSGLKTYTWTKRRSYLFFEKQEMPYKFMRYLRDFTRQLPWYDVGQAGEDQLIRDIAELKGDAEDQSPIYLAGPIPDFDIVVNVFTALDMNNYFQGTYRPFTYQDNGAGFPPGISFNSATGVISGTPSIVGAYNGIRMRGFDSQANEFDSNQFRLRVMTQEQFDGLYP